MPKSFNNQRHFLRITRPGTIALWNGRQAELLSIRDLSPGGVFIYSSMPKKIGAFLTLRIHLSDSRGVTVLAKVVRQAQAHEYDGYAVEFIDISIQDRQHIHDIVNFEAKAA